MGGFVRAESLILISALAAGFGCTSKVSVNRPISDAEESEAGTNGQGGYSGPRAEQDGDTDSDQSSSTQGSAAGTGGSSEEDRDGGATSAGTSAAKLTADDCVDPNLSRLASDQTIMLCDGTLAQGTLVVPSACATDGEVGCISSSSFKAAKMSDFSDADIRVGRTVAGVVGALSGSPSACASDGETGCLTSASFPAVDKAGSLQANASSIRTSVTVAGVTGTLATCASDGSSGCYVPSYAAASQPYKAIDADYIDSNKAKIRTSLTLGGIAGTLADCSSNAATGCVTTSSYKSADLTNLTAGNIKSGVTIAGQAGDYPSATYPLASADGTADLTSATFDAKVKDGVTNFEWFDSAGTRYARAGDSDIDADNIKTGISIFGTSGNVYSITAGDAWNLRAGVTFGSVTGKLKTSCRNSANTSIRDIQFPGTSATVDNTTDRLTVPSHGLSSNDQVRILYSSEPGNLSAANTYYVRLVDSDTIELSSSAGPGAAYGRM